MSTIPETIGRYKVISLVGRGGMAEVYAGVDPLIGREVAIKVMPRELLHDATFRSRFELEASTLASLEHHSIVTVYDFGEADGRPFLVMQLLKGGTLSQRLKDGPLQLAEALRILKSIAAGLDEAHGRGIIHRDLKPGNILFDSANEPYITDFGLVKLAEATATLTGNVIVGTPAYMSPEQGRGEKDLDARSDIYSMGVILFEMLSGQPPYKADTDMALIIKQISAPIPNIQDFNPSLPANCQELINRSMNKRREGRFSTAGEMVQALQAVNEGKAIPALQAAPPAKTDKKKAGDSLVGLEKVEALPEEKKSNKALSLILGLLALLLITVGIAGGVTYSQGMWNVPTLQALVNPQTVTSTTVMEFSVTSTPRPMPTLTRAPGSTRAPTLEPTTALTLTEELPPTQAPVAGESLFPVDQFGNFPSPGVSVSIDTIPQVIKAAVLGQGVFYDLLFTRDGSQVAVAASSGVYFYTPASLEQLDWLPAQSPVLKIAFSPDGKLLAGAEQDSAVVWDWQAGTKLLTITPPDAGYVDYVGFSPDNSVLIGGSSSTYLWDAATGELLTSFLDVPASIVSVSIDHQYVAVPLEDTIQLVRLADSSLVREFKFYNAYQTAFLPDGDLMVAAGGDIVSLLNLDGTAFGKIGGTNLLISGDGSSLVVDNGKGLIQIWRLNEFAMPQFPLRYYEYDNMDYAINYQVSRTGAVVAYWNVSDIVYQKVLSPDFIQVQDVIEGTNLGRDTLARPRFNLTTAQLEPMYKMAFSPADGKSVVTLRDYSVLEAWDVTTSGTTHILAYRPQATSAIPYETHRYQFPAKDTQVATLDNKLTAAAHGTNVQINFTDGSALHTLQANLVADPDIAFSPNSELLATLSTGGMVRIWEIATGKQVCAAGLLAQINDAGKLFFSDDSSMFVIHHTNDDVSYWNASKCTQVKRYELDPRQYSPDGGFFVEIRPDRLILRRVENGAILREFYGRFQQPMGFDASGEFLAATEMDGTVHIWAVSPP